MIEIKLIPTHLLTILRDSGMDDSQIKRSSPRKLLDAMLEWEGIIGYTTMICDAMDDFNEAEVDPDQKKLPFCNHYG